jgi:hypothetical protein
VPLPSLKDFESRIAMSEQSPFESAEEEQKARARARVALLIGGLPEKTLIAVEKRLDDVDWRILAAAQDTLFMATNSVLGIRQFWALPTDDGRTLLEAMETTDPPDQFTSRMYEHVAMIQERKSQGKAIS